MIKTRKPLRLPTFEQQRALGVISDGRPAETWLGVPIFVGDEVIGVVSLQSFQPDDFPDADLRLLTTLTANMGVALDNARLFEAERQRAAELETINRIGQALSAQLELGALIEMVGDTMREIFAAQNVYVALYDRAKGQIDFPYDLDAGQRLAGTSIKLGEGLTSQIIQTRQPLLLNRAALQQHAAAGITPLGTPARSFLGVPIIAGDEPIGVISVQNTERDGVFSEADLRLLTTIAANVGVAIQNARLYEEARRRANEMAALAEIGHDIATTVDLEPVLERIVAQAKQLLRVRDIALYMRDPETRTFPAVVVLGQYVEAIKALPIQVGRGIIGDIARTSLAEVVNQPELDPRTLRIPGTPLPAEELEGLMCAPLLSRGQVIGLLGVWRPRADGSFSQADLDFLISVARQAAIAIESARLYLETRRQANEMAALADVGRDVSATLDLPTVLERIASHAKDLLAADTSAVFLAEADGATFRAIVVLGDLGGRDPALPGAAGGGNYWRPGAARRGRGDQRYRRRSARRQHPRHAAAADRSPDGCAIGHAQAGDRPDDGLARIRAHAVYARRPQLPGRPGAPGHDRDRERALVRGDSAGAPGRRCRQCRQEHLLGEYEPRAAHAAQRGAGLRTGDGARRGAFQPAERASWHHHPQRRASAWPDQRCAGNVQDRGRARHAQRNDV